MAWSRDSSCCMLTTWRVAPSALCTEQSWSAQLVGTESWMARKQAREQ
jgi:hypothetical protein